jgi:hypothetical protein
VYINTPFWIAILLMLVFVVELQTIPPGFEARKVAVGSYELRIKEEGSKCTVIYKGPHNGEITLDIPPPCEFLRDHTGKAQRQRYRRRRNAGFFDVILVIGGPLDTEKTHELMKDGCATQAQAVSLSSRGVVAGIVGSGILVCPLDHLDEKFFGSIAKQV